MNADMVAKWERGTKTPSRRYRELLGWLYGMDQPLPAAGADASLPGRTAASYEQRALVETFEGILLVVDQLGAAALVLQPRIMTVWRDEIIRRRLFMKLAALGPTIALDASLTDRSAEKPSREAVARLDELAGRYHGLYHSISPSILIAPVVTHLETLKDLLSQNMPAVMRRQLLSNKAEVATLAGRISFFDLSDTTAGRGYFHLALECALGANDHCQAAAALGHMAFLPASERNQAAALDYLARAGEHLREWPNGPMSSWLAAVESEVQANLGSAGAADAAVERARMALDAKGLNESLRWFDYFDRVRLDGFAGYAALRSGKVDLARQSLQGALAGLPPEAVKQRAVYMCDLASVELRGGDLEHACAVAGNAVDQLRQAGYATASDRIKAFRTAVRPWQSSSAVRLFDEQLTSVA
ncbi:MAG: hypothetical protein M3256_23890 [Actinomycetota bacterium]|nr:hypothetical protein [Actinomycetota bacterium]